MPLAMLNRPEPTRQEFLPGPQGRREFISDLKNGEVRTPARHCRNGDLRQTLRREGGIAPESLADDYHSAITKPFLIAWTQRPSFLCPRNILFLPPNGHLLSLELIPPEALEKCQRHRQPNPLELNHYEFGSLGN